MHAIIAIGVVLVLLRFSYEVGKQDGYDVGYQDGYEYEQRWWKKLPKKKRLMFPMKCKKCGKEPTKKQQEGWEVIDLNCSCGGRIAIDFTQPYYGQFGKTE